MRLAALLLLALISTGAARAGAQTPQQSPPRNAPSAPQYENPRVSKIIEEAEKHLRLGESNLQNNKRRAARKEFDKALDTVLESGIDVRAEPRLQSYYRELIERIHRYEASAGGSGQDDDGEQEDDGEQKSAPSPLDRLSDEVMGPKDVAYLRGKSCDEDAIEKIELRGFKLGMTVAEVKARVPNLRLRAADRFNFVNYGVKVKTDKYLSQAPMLKGVESISIQFIDNRVSGISFIYDNSAGWESGKTFAAQVSSALGLKTRWMRYVGNHEMSAFDDLNITVCRDSVLVAGLRWMQQRSFPILHARDLAALALLNQRRQAAADKQREAEERRRRSFKP